MIYIFVFTLGAYFTFILIDNVFFKSNRKRKEKLRKQKLIEKKRIKKVSIQEIKKQMKKIRTSMKNPKSLIQLTKDINSHENWRLKDENESSQKLVEKYKKEIHEFKENIGIKNIIDLNQVNKRKVWKEVRNNIKKINSIKAFDLPLDLTVEEAKIKVKKIMELKFKKIIEEKLDENKFKLVNEKNKLIKVDSYGNKIPIKWEEERSYFFKTTILPKLKSEDRNFCATLKLPFNQDKYFRYTVKKIEVLTEELINKNISVWESTERDAQSGIWYENVCKNILEKEGWKVETTPITGDQGVDLIGYIENFKVCIQCKDFSNPVGNKALQEVIAGKIHYQGTHSVVVAKSGFTKKAHELANTAKVILISEIELENLENLL